MTLDRVQSSLGTAAYAALGLLMVYIGSCGVYGIACCAIEGRWRRATAPAVMTICATVALWRMWGVWRRWTAKRRADRRFAAGRCASCAYDLSSLAPATDGCTVCPECGAAWRINPARS